jgi:hypothetical protein
LSVEAGAVVVDLAFDAAELAAVAGGVRRSGLMGKRGAYTKSQYRRALPFQPQ